MGAPLAFQGTLQLLDWSETKRGQKVVFEVMLDPEKGETEHPFKRFTSKNGKVAGQMFAAVLVEFDPATDKPKPATPPAEKPAQSTAEHMETLNPIVSGTKPKAHKSHFPDGLCGLAVRWCDDDHFQAWVEETFSDLLKVSAETDPAVRAKAAICAVCGVDSRKQIDEMPSAAALFRSKIMVPYKLQREEDGVDKGNF